MTEPDKTRHISGLSQKQYDAIDAILSGATDQEAADKSGVSRQTVNGWKNNAPEFIGELNRRRELMREMHLDKMQAVIGRTLQVLVDDLDGKYLQFKRETAFHVLKAASVYLKSARPIPVIKPETSPEPTVKPETSPKPLVKPETA